MARNLCNFITLWLSVVLFCQNIRSSEAEGGGGGDAENREILVSKTLKINNKNNRNDILSVTLSDHDINLIGVEVGPI